MKKVRFFAVLFAALLVLCSCAEEKPTDAPSAQDGEKPDLTLELDGKDTNAANEEASPIILLADEHPELDLGYAEDERVLRDFAVDADGTLYLLQRDGVVLTYNARGEWQKTYDLNLSEQGLTA